MRFFCELHLVIEMYHAALTFLSRFIIDVSKYLYLGFFLKL